MRFAKPAISTAPIGSSGAPSNGGSRAISAPSTAQRAKNAGHSQAPRMRQRSRVSRTRAECSTLRRVTLDPIRQDPRRRSRAGGHHEGAPEDPGGAQERGVKPPVATETARSEPDVSSEHLTLEDRTGLLRAMLMMRGIEERAMMLYRQGKVPGSFYDGYGQEAVSAGPTWA